eukprot:CAMPEP_0116125056 /NCGR_PEP_ID=MMETSP0329-20121206/5609_1 /TAXON_ID=697910 /ORGANISM="Pseudo-nitzschia arenysensis, Strain B593" /LENGTH=96 /DNA_ID=CAMNT_0003619075 /DNA_START=55 /DNA_END=344 /DNA_ORIENTATION=-
MALRRPPTRVEMKADDIDEYSKIMREKEMSMEDPVAMQLAAAGNHDGIDGGRRKVVKHDAGDKEVERGAKDWNRASEVKTSNEKEPTNSVIGASTT